MAKKVDVVIAKWDNPGKVIVGLLRAFERFGFYVYDESGEGEFCYIMSKVKLSKIARQEFKK